MLYLRGNFLYTCGYLAGNMQAICIGLIDVTFVRLVRRVSMMKLLHILVSIHTTSLTWLTLHLLECFETILVLYFVFSLSSTENIYF